MNVRDLMIALVRFALRGGAPDWGAVNESLSEEKLATLFKVSKGHDVAHLVAYALEQGGFFCEWEAWHLFLKEKEQASLRYEMMQADFDEVCACFDKERIDYIPLKGAVVRSFYPKPWMRTSCDIDILVRERDLKRAVEALVSACGYRVEGKENYHDVSLFSPFGMHLELHHSIKENIPKYDELLTQVWEFSSPCGGSRHLQTNEFLVFHLTAHMAYHFLNGGCGLRSVLDLYLIKDIELNKEKLKEMLCSAGLDRFYKVAIDLGEYWLGELKEPSDTLLEAEKYILLGGAYGTQRQGTLSQQVKRGGKFKYFWSRVFMPYESLAVLYPVIKKHKMLTPFCQIARWLGAIFKGKKIKKEIKNVTSANEIQVAKTKKLLEDLGL
ncbi:MAG: nucleotidyltransferase family protein [Clostridia bacterium]|nr:nucleotidyltransferase family protein [Clostridia bacterium]